MVIHGGYVDGTKWNDLWTYDFASKEWSCLDKGAPSEDTSKPCPRIGSVISYRQADNKLYVLSGCDEDGEKINDFWSFDLGSNKWTKIEEFEG
jgi:hypothetical protein